MRLAFGLLKGLPLMIQFPYNSLDGLPLGVVGNALL